MTADPFLADIEQRAPMLGALFAIVGAGRVFYRVTSRRRSDRSHEQ